MFYYLEDQIGSSRKMLQEGQTTACYDGDFEPFGGEHTYVNTCPQNYKFTGKERDTESNLDNFGARYYASMTGRFMTPDWDLKPVAVPYAKFGDPQTLNLYSYVENSPLNRIDADGHGDPPPNLTDGGKVDSAQHCAAGGSAGMECNPDPTLNGTTTAHKNTVTVTVDQVKSANPFGHATIKVDGGQKVGLVPNSDKEAAKAVAKEAAGQAAGVPTPTPVPGHVEPLAAGRTIENTATLHVTPDQAKAMQATIDKSVQNLRIYDPGYFNCAGFVELVLRSGGVNAPDDRTPGGLVEDLKQQNPPQ